MMMKQIVVGLDASPASEEAVRWAALEGSKTGAPVVAVHAYTTEHGGGPGSPERRRVEDAVVRSLATSWLDHALSSSPFEPSRVRLQVREGALPEVLASFEPEAAVVVLGRRRDDSPGRDADSRGLHLKACPVVFVPELPERERSRETVPPATR